MLKQLIDSSIKKDMLDGKGGAGYQQHELLIMNLKRELDQALKNLSLRETEYKALQKTTKVTKFKELDVNL